MRRRQPPGVPPAAWKGILLAWLALILVGAALVVMHWDELTADITARVFTGDNILILALLYPLLKAFHEFGHALAVKALGGIPISKVITLTGIVTLLLAPFGAFALNLSAITAAICMGPQAHEDRAKRYTAAVSCGAIYVLIGLFGAALFYGDGILTPAISVLSAVEGLAIVTPAFQSYVLPLSMIILVGLFLMQRRGTGAVGALFGPVMVLWFLTLGGLGVASIGESPVVLGALLQEHRVAVGHRRQVSRKHDLLRPHGHG